MGRIWQRSSDGEWISVEIREAAVLHPATIELIDGACAGNRQTEARILACTAVAEPSGQWVLIAPAAAGVNVNGRALEKGIHVLSDRDAIRLPGAESCFFSNERLARVEPFPEHEPVHCPRCKLPIEAGHSAVCCPQCGVWHHELRADTDGIERRCFTHARTCALCDQPTELESPEYRWSPEHL